MMRRAHAYTWVLLAALAGGCGDDPSPTEPTTPMGPTTETFASNLVVQGAAWRLVQASQAGTLSATLASSSQPTTPVGLGIGIRSNNGTGCLVSSAVTAAAGTSPQLSLPVDAGIYCVKIFDVGALTDPMGFSITIVRP